MRETNDAPPRTASSTPTQTGATPADSPTSGMKAVRMSSIASRAREASMCEGIPATRQIRAMVGFSGPTPGPDAGPAPAASVSPRAPARSSGSARAAGWARCRRPPSALMRYITGTASREQPAPSHRAASIRPAKAALWLASPRVALPRMKPEISGPAIWPMEKAAVNQPNAASMVAGEARRPMTVWPAMVKTRCPMPSTAEETMMTAMLPPKARPRPPRPMTAPPIAIMPRRVGRRPLSRPRDMAKSSGRMA